MNIYAQQIMDRVQMLQAQAIEAHNQWARLDPYHSRQDYDDYLWACCTMAELPELIGAECLSLTEAPESASMGHYCEKIRLSVVALAREMHL